MARFGSQMKMGYYKTPEVVVRQIKEILNISPRARLLDTCCGEGGSLRIIASDTEAVTYGIELDKERYNTASGVLDNVVWGDALYELRTQEKGFGLLWLNPPYDFEEGDYGKDESMRLEIKFLERHWRFLMDKGVLVYIVPFNSMKKSERFLKRRCSNLTILSFPETEYGSFSQVVVMCTKEKPLKEEIDRNTLIFDSLRDLESDEVPEFLRSTEQAERRYDVPVSDDDIYFRSFRLNPDEAVQKVSKSPLWDRMMQKSFPVLDGVKMNPLMPLREGHLAMLLASGMMNGEVTGSDGTKLIVKGSVRKEVVATYEETESSEKEIETDRYSITVRAISFDPLEIITINNKETKGEEE